MDNVLTEAERQYDAQYRARADESMQCDGVCVLVPGEETTAASACVKDGEAMLQLRVSDGEEESTLAIEEGGSEG